MYVAATCKMGDDMHSNYSRVVHLCIYTYKGWQLANFTGYFARFGWLLQSSTQDAAEQIIYMYLTSSTFQQHPSTCTCTSKIKENHATALADHEGIEISTYIATMLCNKLKESVSFY